MLGKAEQVYPFHSVREDRLEKVCSTESWFCQHSSLVLQRSFELLLCWWVATWVVLLPCKTTVQWSSPSYGQEYAELYAELFHETGFPDPVTLKTLRKMDAPRVPLGVCRAVINRLGEVYEDMFCWPSDWDTRSQVHVIISPLNAYPSPFRGAYAVDFNACRERPWRWGCWVCRW